MFKPSGTATEKNRRKPSPTAPKRLEAKTTGAVTATARTTRAAGEPQKMADILSKGREELYKVSNGLVDWANATHDDARVYLIQKGYLEQSAHTQLSMAKTALVVLRIAADGGGATASDGLRAVAVMLEKRRIDLMLDDIRDELCSIADLAAQREEERVEREDATTHTLLEAAAVLMRTVEEQVEVTRGAVSELEVATSRAADAAIDLREAQDTGAGMGEPESPDC
ncbi:hypothetical protein C8J57DRAFT_1226641 [Mycena rebaudengoi]|nr:hypothetical protein C8J57DRAFT_1226641 [Mycena rebaudengoi]